MYYEKQLVRALELLIQQGKVTDAGGLDVDITAFSFWRRTADVITKVTAAGSTGNTLTNATTNYVYVVEATATITIALTVPAAGHFPLAEVVTAGGDITGITDKRSFFNLPWEGNHLFLGTKGDILGHTGSAESIFPIGTAGSVLTVDPTSSVGYNWVIPSPPGTHASSHIGTGTDPIPVTSSSASGLIPAITGSALDFYSGGGSWATLPLVTTSNPGVVPTRDGVADNALGGDGTWRPYRTIDWWRYNGPGTYSPTIGTNPHQNILWTAEGSSGSAGVTVDTNGRIILTRPPANQLFTYDITWHTTKQNLGDAFYELHVDNNTAVLAKSGDSARNTINTEHAFSMSYILDVHNTTGHNVYEIWKNAGNTVNLVADATRNKLTIKRYRLHV